MMDTIDLTNLARDCSSEPTPHKGGHARRLPLKYMLDGVNAVAWSFERYLNTGKFPQIVTDQVP